MPLLSVFDLPVGPLTPKQALARAEAQVAAWLCPGLPGLEVTSWNAEYRPRNDQRAYGVPRYGTRVIGPSVLRRWPVTGLTSVSVDGVDVTGECAFDFFSIRRDALAPEFGGLGLVSVVFQTGWTPDTLPEPVLEAVRMTTAALLSAAPLDVKAETIGEHSITYRDDATGTGDLPGAVQDLLRPFRAVLI